MTLMGPTIAHSLRAILEHPQQTRLYLRCWGYRRDELPAFVELTFIGGEQTAHRTSK